LSSIAVGGKDNKVYLLTLDAELRELSKVETPLIGLGGRDYQMILSPHGHLIIGQRSEANPQKFVPQKILVEFDSNAKLIWQQSISSQWTPLLAPFRAGFFLGRERSDIHGFDVEKYTY